MRTRRSLSVLSSAALLVMLAARAHAAPPPARWTFNGIGKAKTPGPVATPANLFGCDINVDSALRGELEFDPATGIYKISGSGSDIWDNADRFSFTSRLVKGDVQISARILEKPSKTSHGAKAGVMIREALDGPSRMVYLAGTFKNGIVYQYREKTGGAAVWPGKAAIATNTFSHLSIVPPPREDVVDQQQTRVDTTVGGLAINSEQILQEAYSAPRPRLPTLGV